MEADKVPTNEYIADRYNGIGIKYPQLGLSVPEVGPWGVDTLNDEFAANNRLKDNNHNYLTQEYSMQWIDFAWEYAQEVGFVTEESLAQDEILLDSSDNQVPRSFVASLAFLHDFSFHGETNKRKPYDGRGLLSEGTIEEHEVSQNTQFHHALRLGIIVAKIHGGPLNATILHALFHDVFDPQPKLGKRDTLQIHHTAEVSTDDKYAHLQKIFGEESPFPADIVKTGKMMDVIEDTAELGRHRDDQDFDINSYIGGIKQKLKEFCEGDSVCLQEIDKSLSASNGDSAEQLRSKLILLIARIAPGDAIRAMAANIFDNILFPRLAKDGSGADQKSLGNDVNEALDFYLHLLEAKDYQEAIRAIKDECMGIRYPTEYEALIGAVKELRESSGDPIGEAIEVASEFSIGLIDKLESEGYALVDIKAYEQQILELRRQSSTYAEFVENVKIFYNQLLANEYSDKKGLYILTKPRTKGLGSIIAKVIGYKDREDDPYHAAINLIREKRGDSPIEKYTVAWWKELLLALGDPLASRAVVLAVRDEDNNAIANFQERDTVDFLDSVLDFIEKNDDVGYRLDAKSIAELDYMQSQNGPMQNTLTSIVGRILQHAELSNTNVMERLIEKKVKKGEDGETIKYNATHLALALAKIGFDFHLFLSGVEDYLASLYGEGSHLNYKLNGTNASNPDAMVGWKHK